MCVGAWWCRGCNSAENLSVCRQRSCTLLSPTPLQSLLTPTLSSPPHHHHQVEDFDEGVVHQLNAKRTWEEAADAVRHLASYDLATIQHPAAYINHVVKHYNAAGGGVGSVGSGFATVSGQIRLASVPISTKVRLCAGGSLWEGGRVRWWGWKGYGGDAQGRAWLAYYAPDS